MRKKLTLAILIVLLATPAFATTRLTKLTENRYLLSHQKQTRFGGQGKALRAGYEKAASLCVVLGYRWFEINDTQSSGQSYWSGAAATMEVTFHQGADDENGEGLLECENLATEKQKLTMQKALLRIKR